MTKINYTAVKGSNTMGSKPFYIGIVQHRSCSLRGT